MIRGEPNLSDTRRLFAQRLPRTYMGTDTAGMAEFVEDERLSSDDGNCMVVTGSDAGTAWDTLVLVPYRLEHRNIPFPTEIRIDKQMAVGRLHIAVQKPDTLPSSGESICQVHRERRLAGPSLAAGNCDNHRSRVMDAPHPGHFIELQGTALR